MRLLNYLRTWVTQNEDGTWKAVYRTRHDRWEVDGSETREEALSELEHFVNLRVVEKDGKVRKGEGMSTDMIPDSYWEWERQKTREERIERVTNGLWRIGSDKLDIIERILDL